MNKKKLGLEADKLICSIDKRIEEFVEKTGFYSLLEIDTTGFTQLGNVFERIAVGFKVKRLVPKNE